jgi:hypothetical protein
MQKAETTPDNLLRIMPAKGEKINTGLSTGISATIFKK